MLSRLRRFSLRLMGAPCVVQLLTWLHVSDYRVFFFFFFEHWKMIALNKDFSINNCFSHRNVLQNGFNTLSKMVYHFLSKSSKFGMVRTIRYCSHFTSMWSKYLSNYGDKFSNGNRKWPTGKSIFAVNLRLKLFRATNADTESLKSLHTFLKNVCITW